VKVRIYEIFENITFFILKYCLSIERERYELNYDVNRKISILILVLCIIAAADLFSERKRLIFGGEQCFSYD
jgi:hypothetical protein